MNFWAKEVIGPLAARIGTAAGAWLVGRYGIDGQLAEEIAVGLAAAALVAADLVIRQLMAKR